MTNDDGLLTKDKGRGAELPSIWFKVLLTGRNLLRAVDDGQHVDLIGLDVIDDSIRTLQDFATSNSGTTRPDKGNSAICCERLVKRSTMRSAY